MLKPDIFQNISNWQKDRPIIDKANKDINLLLSLLAQEVIELEEEVVGQNRPEWTASEAVDVIFFSLAIIEMMGIDPKEAMKQKLAKNTLKYPAHIWQDGSYQDCKKETLAQYSKQDEIDFYSM